MPVFREQNKFFLHLKSKERKGRHTKKKQKNKKTKKQNKKQKKTNKEGLGPSEVARKKKKTKIKKEKREKTHTHTHAKIPKKELFSYQ